MMKMKSLFGLMALGIGGYLSGSSAIGQTVERDTTITGPRGRTIKRQVEVQRGPNGIDRSVQIQRPGGTFDRQVQVQRSPGWRPPLGGPWPRPAWFPRPVVVGAPVPAFGFGLAAAPMLNFSFGGGGGGGVGGGMFGGGPGGPGPGGPGPGGPGPGGPGAGPQPPDQVTLMTQRLQSFISSNRKEAAYTLGHLHDPRAVPSLVHVLKYDSSKDVRVASAIALGEIGGSDSAVALERCAIYDKKEEVRKAATTALERLNAQAKNAPPIMSQVAPSANAPRAPVTSTPSPFGQSPPPALEPPSEPAQADPAGSQPPPPPAPVTSAPSGNGN
jgi:HEAT repeats